MTDLLPAPKPRKSGKMIAAIIAFASAAAGGGAGAVVAVLALGDRAATARRPVVADAGPHVLEYVELDNAFTSNLVDTGRYLQLRIAVSTTGGAPVTAALVQHKLAIVSSILAVLGEMGEADVADRGAKDKLRGAVRTAINDVLRRKAGVSGIDEVFFTSLVVQ